MRSVLNKTLRGKMFRLLDKLHGSEIYSSINDLARINSLDSQDDQLNTHQEYLLQQLLNHAIQTTSFYSKQKKWADLGLFPVVYKEMIRRSQKDFLSNLYSKNKLYKMVTSGSTGTPFNCYQDRAKKKRVNAEIIYYSSKAGYNVGKKLINLKALPVDGASAKLQQVVQNVDVIDVSLMGDENIEQLLIRLERLSKNGATLLAYASTYDRLSEYFKQSKKSYSFNVSGLISSSELLFDDTRAVIEEVFGCRCYSRYSNQENGLLGQDDIINNVFLLNEAHYYVEIMKLEQDVLADAGEIGRIVVTDFYNYAMPMIRYDTGDVGAVTYLENNGVRKKALTGFQGRKIDLVYDSSGRSLSPHKISVTLRNFNEVRQFQFIQQSEAKYLVSLKVEGAFEKEEELLKQLKALLGEKAQVEFEYPDEIPALKSGKRNYIINQMIEGNSNADF